MMRLMLRKYAAVTVVAVVAMAMVMQFHHHHCMCGSSHESTQLSFPASLFCLDHHVPTDDDGRNHGDCADCEDACGLQLAPATLTADDSLYQGFLPGQADFLFTDACSAEARLSGPMPSGARTRLSGRPLYGLCVRPVMLSSAPTRGTPGRCITCC